MHLELVSADGSHVKNGFWLLGDSGVTAEPRTEFEHAFSAASPFALLFNHPFSLNFIWLYFSFVFNTDFGRGKRKCWWDYNSLGCVVLREGQFYARHCHNKVHYCGCHNNLLWVIAIIWQVLWFIDKSIITEMTQRIQF